MKHIRSASLLGLITIGIISIGSCAIFSQSYQPDSLTSAMIDELELQERITIEQRYIRLDPQKSEEIEAADLNQHSAIIFYPGAKVAPLAYLPLWERISSSGYTVFIADMPLDFAFLRIHAARTIHEQYPNYDSWIISGHSLGGAMAGEHLKRNWQNYDALILIGSYLGSSTDLSQMRIPVLSIREEFGLPDSQEKADAVRGNLPAHTFFEIIPGANHAQYGNYGIQRDDGTALISRQEQQEITAKLILDFLTSHAIRP